MTSDFGRVHSGKIIAEDKEKVKAFEEMKKQHPENVYEPHH
jgi:hypothetical protein